MNWLVVDDILLRGLKEDNLYGDITTDTIISDDSICSVDIIVKENGVIAGLEVFRRVFILLGKVDVEFYVNDGDKVEKSQVIGKIKGNTRNVLTGERLALNLLQRMSGIATVTRQYVNEVKGTKARVLDTRKTTPNLRIFEKYAVKVGGGCNHRFNLSDGVLIKDNHIAAAGGIKQAIALARNNVSFVRKIEVEVESIEQVIEALEAGADIIMLDNMDNNTMKEAVSIINGRALVEASGNVSLETIKGIAETGVDFISVGKLTHSYKSLDISMKNLKLL
ncbi:putative nicotinate-nucleotide pyrophosphorylase [Clostridium tepidiprofundi DSM 19306]|uniref:Probable nicotinate-nucleotide pyrophosphorylase [carboxylating] n=1 Tax=Clostridium tepidiprofundi DSM 19306 TaxID=1121338 RepID=A0A151B3A3_9CLOT|nr:carboxylating nicotinate-nucleotide diphosphorylase [Clostridium tepidiprofundi]KYH34232.1 putative nicotinate-nucleotide pyrophosphorylase [Clostridium tepidiprofundi DSM 19306]